LASLQEMFKDVHTISCS